MVIITGWVGGAGGAGGTEGGEGGGGEGGGEQLSAVSSQVYVQFELVEKELWMRCLLQASSESVPSNMPVMPVTLPTSHWLTSLLKAAAPSNMCDIVCTLLVSKMSGWLKALALRNM